MEVRKVSIREAKRRIKNDPELRKMLVRSGWRDIALDLDGDGVADVAFASDSLGRKIDSMAVDLTGSGEFNLYLRDLDGNGIPDTIMLVEDGQEEMSAVAIGGAVELGFINLGVKIANLLVAEEFLNQELGLSLADLAAYMKANAARMLEEMEKRQNAVGIDKVYYYLNDAGTYYLATVDGDKPKVRPFGTILLYDGKLYIQTGNGKDVTKQLAENPHAEICASMAGSWLRIAAELVLDNNHEAKVQMLEKLPTLKQMYNADDDSMQMYYLKDASAGFFSFTSEPEFITF